MIRKNWGDDGALTLIRVVLERTEDQELREQLLEFKTTKSYGQMLTRKTSTALPPLLPRSGWQVINHKVTKQYN